MIVFVYSLRLFACHGISGTENIYGSYWTNADKPLKQLTHLLKSHF